jgi:ATP-dependent Clp protease, protease subunit
VFTTNGKGYDIYSRLLEDRIIFLNGEINDDLANSIIAQLLLLESLDNNKDIKLYINSPGGSVDSGLAILDTMNLISCTVCVYCVGIAASMAAILVSAGEKGKRYILPNSRMMLHQPLGGVQGRASDIEVVSNEIVKIKRKINQILSTNTGQSVEKIETDISRDYYLSSVEAIEYGLVDKIVERKK